MAYRETITRSVEDEYTHKKQSGGSGQYAKINYIIEPNEPGTGYSFESTVTGGNVPREFWPAVDKGFKSMLDKGTMAGFPLVDIKVNLTDGGFHAVDSSSIAFEIAAKAAFRQTVPKCAPQLMEPIMKVDTFTPDAHVGDVIGDLNRRRGMIKSQEAGATGVRIKSEVPLSEMFGYIGDLRTMTSGRGQFSMEFSHYLPCPKSVADAVIKEVQERNAGLQGSQMGYTTQVHRFLNGTGSQHGKTRLTTGINVAVISKDRKSMSGKCACTYVENCWQQLSGNLVHVWNHQQ